MYIYIYIYMYLDHTDSYLGSPLLLFLGSMYSWLDFFVDLLPICCTFPKSVAAWTHPCSHHSHRKHPTGFQHWQNRCTILPSIVSIEQGAPKVAPNLWCMKWLSPGKTPRCHRKSAARWMRLVSWTSPGNHGGGGPGRE